MDEASREQKLVEDIRRHVRKMLQDPALKRVTFTFEKHNGGVRRGNVGIEFTAQYEFTENAGAF